ncbi:threonine--tRNA ligase [Staphylococcus saprophyticus]|jgi:threonyl-tRNA synthetase|uniref:Threonine--tRNA ligase n=1 Tax=Staphylococcus saprophyticus subsp. saprophyticus (strain ATCC 15305 / DSM 20229 / NCIMB 8711 / NCTC 7292 / S-41) TaxID=342451 RepID=SYT_STAS1|nr:MULTISPECIES: threonine--tRNA ligase [Staphylococcus]Q49YB4.1 RecName: Full=Threonine--tRNA ligase; AltName: Full=Threonyl-tRNA synthetase; Short=ThrRS [Staphylococcus saprophyticus subsp. saprophyticus ATCC 15305 = NCTC 7292]CRV16236.1 threonyl-tRNA ligase [Streptococcus equi subsp. equi]AMG20197.1 threonine--tRNA ligase [Staphylococcus saprophyticus]AMG33257.1 threonine--tRNA ligase [Staphylococcus saprophyticus]ASE59178.1 threonine--tRNA ligase [Staphylococcus saprophyticus]ASF17948.1 t
MDQIKIKFPDGNTKEFDKGTTTEDIAQSISPGLRKKAVAGKLNGQLIDLTRPIESDGDIEIVTPGSDEALEVLRHSTAHLMAQALKRLYGEVHFGVGPVIEGGFYYDFDMEESISSDDFEKIEKTMKQIANENYPIERKVVSRNEAKAFFSDDPYKQELIDAIPEDENVTLYTQGEFTDLCRGVHVPSTSKIKEFKLLSTAGAYWRGDSNNKMLQRIYGTAFFDKKDLKAHLQMLEERKERDHRKIGKELELFSNNPLVGAGLPLWLPNGATIRREIERYIVDKEVSMGYDHVYTPVMANVDLYKTSGHWDHYQEDMFPTMKLDEYEEMVLRPMNCPHHMMIYANKPHSYRELPIRIAELGTMHRYEASGAVSGLQRVRGMTLNDAHIFVRPDQIKEEFKRVVNLIIDVYNDFNFENYSFRLSYRDPEDKEKYFDDDEMWIKAESMLKEAVDELGLDYEEAIGEAAFYGPKLDVQVQTAMGKEETLSTAQLDFLLPQKFELTYIGNDGEQHRPVVIHRGVVSTMERFVAFLTEETKGAFPTWLAPKQVEIIPVNVDLHYDYARLIQDELKSQGVRVEIDDRNEKMGYKIREAQMQKIPYQLVVGDKEVENKEVNVRKYGSQDQETLEKDEFIWNLVDEIRLKKQR